MSQFFENLIFSQDIWGNVHYVREVNLISLYIATSLPDISRTKQIKRNLRHTLVEERQLKTIMPK